MILIYFLFILWYYKAEFYMVEDGQVGRTKLEIFYSMSAHFFILGKSLKPANILSQNEPDIEIINI